MNFGTSQYIITCELAEKRISNTSRDRYVQTSRFIYFKVKFTPVWDFVNDQAIIIIILYIYCCAIVMHFPNLVGVSGVNCENC